MSPALYSSVGIVGYLALFTSVGLLFLFANLLLGRFLRPNDPHEEKLEIYIPNGPRLGTNVIEAVGITKAFDEKLLYEIWPSIYRRPVLSVLSVPTEQVRPPSSG